MKITETSIPGCFEITAEPVADERGVFIKTFHRGLFAARGMRTDFEEEFHSVSRRGVLRGLHFQLPPKEHAKLVWLAGGEALDAVVDLRVGSPTYGRHLLFRFTAEKPTVLYIPPGLAHGFYAGSDNTVMMYKVTRGYSPEHDSGILWDSAGIAWPDVAPVLSPRDRNLVAFSTFASPFRYDDRTFR
jgi:dTDP-4-dehydrorhamnose 3,5-epimerase